MVRRGLAEAVVRIAAVVLLCGLGGCDYEPRPAPELEAFEPCPGGNLQEVDLSETTSLGFSAADVLSNIEGAHTSVLTWLPASFSYAQEGGTSIITVAIERRGTAHLSLDAPSCSPQLQIDAVVHLSTSDGVLNEILQTSFATTDERSAWTRVGLDPEAVAGSFEAPASLMLDIYASPLGAGGELRVGLFEPVAVWTQSEACAGAELVGSAAADELNALMAVLPGQGSSPLRYTNETELASVDYSLEVVDGCKGSPSVGGFSANQYSGELTLRSNDGRIDGAFPVELYGVFAPSPDSRVNHALFALGSYDGTTDPESFAPLLQSFGIRDAIDTAAFDALAVEISGHIYLNSARCTLRVDGLRGGRCAVEPSSGRSLCEGSEATTLWRVDF